jgi:hypothetical protein
MSQTSAEHIALTQAFIDENPSTITLLRRTKVPTGTGGWTWSASVEQTPFVARVVGQNLRSFNSTRTSEDGSLVIPTHVLIALPDEDVQVDDQFELEGKLFEVKTVNDRPRWRINAEVVEHAE